MASPAAQPGGAGHARGPRPRYRPSSRTSPRDLAPRLVASSWSPPHHRRRRRRWAATTSPARTRTTTPGQQRRRGRTRTRPGRRRRDVDRDGPALGRGQGLGSACRPSPSPWWRTARASFRMSRGQRDAPPAPRATSSADQSNHPHLLPASPTGGADVDHLSWPRNLRPLRRSAYHPQRRTVTLRFGSSTTSAPPRTSTSRPHGQAPSISSSQSSVTEELDELPDDDGLVHE